MEAAAFQTITVSLILGVSSYTLARWWKIPAILFYLLSGIIFGSMGARIIDAASLGSGLLILVEIAVAIILFEGALSLSSHSFQVESSAIRRVLILTIPLTGLGAAALIHFLLGLSWRLSAVFGSLIVVTGPTVIGPLLKSVHLSHRLQVLLHWEAIWGDVIGVLLSALALELIAPAMDSLGHLTFTFALRLLDGILIGVLGGYLLGRFILPWVSRLRDPILPGLVAVAGALGTFHIANVFIESSGPLAVAFCGFLISHLKAETLQEIRHFKEQLSSLFISTMFVLLSAYIDVFPLTEIWPRMVLVALILGALVRPFSVVLAFLNTDVPWSERIFVGLIGPRGIIAIATAFYASLLLPGAAREMDILLDTTFAIIFLSGAVATALCSPLARLLKVDIPESGLGILFVGVNPFSSALAKFASRYVPVAFVDTNPDSCSLAETLGHETVCADVLDGSVYEEAKEEGFGRLLAVTTNDALNELIAHEAAHHLGIAKSFRVVANAPDGLINLQPSLQSSVAFSEDLSLLDTIKRLEQGRASLNMLGPDEATARGALPLLEVVDQGRGVAIVRPGQEMQNDAVCLISMDCFEFHGK